MDNMASFSFRRTVRISRLISEVGHTDLIEALEELKSLKSSAKGAKLRLICNQCGNDYGWMTMGKIGDDILEICLDPCGCTPNAKATPKELNLWVCEYLAK